MRVELDKVDSAIEYFNGVEEQFQIQKDLYLKKLAADFEVIRKLVERKQIELRDKIEGVYDECLRKAYRYIDGLTAIKQTMNLVTDSSNQLRVDIEQMLINRTLDR
jgi:hypothetical protein